MNDLIKEQSRCIAHEMRNHISICELYTQIIKKNLEKEGIQNTSLNNALNCINKSLKIMSNSLLDLKSLDNFNLKKVNIKKVLEEGIKLATAYISDKKIKITSNINIDAEVFIDENKFLACIVNIIKNAIEAIKKEGKINVSLEIEGDYIHIKISNNGEPISQEKQKSIFEEGFTTKPTGSGLGLHICANNLKAQNATLKLTKSTTEITEFEIILPIV
ncbi:multi-sensor signal transduction histidine kinase [Clostridium sp. CAG:715]|jgi:sensor protein hydH|nr:multi-sensor signal transduction histidine kinase [Clostridium sp. CAG:715]